MLRNYVAIAANTGRGGHGVMRIPDCPRLLSQRTGSARDTLNKSLN